MEREEIERFIMAEVARQVAPIYTAFETRIHSELAPVKTELREQTKKLDHNVDSLDHIKHRQLALWSNGSGGPPGWLEVFADATNEKFQKLSDKMDDARDKVLLREGEDSGGREAVARRHDEVMRWLNLGLLVAAVIAAIVAYTHK